MITSVEEFKNYWARESEGTHKLMSALTDESLPQKVAEGHWSLGRTAWHIIQSIPEMANRTGLNVVGPGEKDPVPSSAEEIRDMYRKTADSILEQITSNWDDSTMLVEDDMYGETWKRGFTLRILMNHETHHRGQMTVLMRQAGLKVPGVYGPSKEEWDQYGVAPPE